MKEKKPFIGTVIAAQIVLFILLPMIPNCHGGPWERDREGRAMGLVYQLKEEIERYRVEHKMYPADLSGIKYDEEGNVAYGPAAGKDGMYELKVWGEDTDEEYYAYTGDPFLYIKRVPRGLGIAFPVLTALSLFLSIRTIIRALPRRAPGEGPRRITASQGISVATSAVFIVAALALLYVNIPRSKEPPSRGFFEMRNLMTNADAYYADHKRYPRDLRELTSLVKGLIWLPYGYTIEFGPISSRAKEYALRLISKDRDIVYEMYTDKGGLYSRKKDEKEDAAKPL